MKKLNIKVNNFKVQEYKQEIIDKAKINDEFIEIIKGKNISKESFETSLVPVEEFVNAQVICGECVGIDKCVMASPGMRPYLKVINGFLEPSLIACRYMTGVLGNKHLNNYVTKYFGSELLAADLDLVDNTTEDRAKLVNELSKFILGEEKFEKGLFVHGAPGVGKTYIMAAFTNALARRGVKVASVFVPEFISDIKTLSKDARSKNDKMWAIKKSKVLVLDDIGGEKVDAWGRDEILLPLINYRVENRLPTFFTSNYSLSDLAKIYKVNGATMQSLRLMERIKVLASPISIGGISRR